MGILIEIALNLQIALVSMDILMIVILPIHEHRVTFHLFVLSSISFISILQFTKYRSFTSLVKLLYRYFILFDTILNGIVFLLSLTVYYQCTEKHRFLYSNLYLETLLKPFISTNVLWWRLQGFLSIYMLSCHLKIVQFYLFLFNLMPFISFYCFYCCGQDFQYCVK